jgi:hypothetical protein
LDSAGYGPWKVNLEALTELRYPVTVFNHGSLVCFVDDKPQRGTRANGAEYLVGTPDLGGCESRRQRISVRQERTRMSGVRNGCSIGTIIGLHELGPRVQVAGCTFVGAHLSENYYSTA